MEGLQGRRRTPHEPSGPRDARGAHAPRDPGQRGARASTRLRTAAASTALALALGWGLTRLVPERAPVALNVRAAELDAVFAGRDDPPSRVRPGEAFYTEPVDEETARKLFVMLTSDLVYDPDCYYRYRPGIEDRVEWEEHPLGAWVRRTNARGLREDADTPLDAGDVSVLVAGDSHTDGVCNNSESFANRLETELVGPGSPWSSAVAWNTGVVGYSFYNYLAVLRQHLALEPDVFVVAVYGGNDFLEVLRPHHFFRGSVLPPRRQGYRNKIMAARKVSSTALAQGLNQVLYFQEYPDQIEVALEAALSTAAETKRLCDAQGIRLVFAYIPPAFEASWAELDEMADRARDVLELSEADLRVARRMADEYLAGLAALGVDAIDLGPAMRAAGEPCYWKRDLHINLVGHALVSREVSRWILAGESGARGVVSEAGAGAAEAVAAREAVALLEEGERVEGQRHGPWTRRYENGELHSSGKWEHGLRTGPWSFWYEDGTLKKRGSYVDGEPDGAWSEWHKSGGLRREAVWVRGRPHGYWRQWHPDGSLASEGDYCQGMRDGVWSTYHEGGRQDTRGTYRLGTLEGLFKRWGPSGEVVSLGAYVGGARAGTWQSFWSDGSPRAYGEYAADERTGPWIFWTEDGEIDVERTGWYRLGRRVSGLGHPGLLTSGP